MMMIEPYVRCRRFPGSVQRWVVRVVWVEGIRLTALGLEGFRV